MYAKLERAAQRRWCSTGGTGEQEGQKVGWIALYDYRQLSGGKNLQKLLNIFFWGCYGLFRGRDGLFRALPSPLRYHKRVFFTSFVRVQKLKVFAGWTDETSQTSIRSGSSILLSFQPG